MNVLLVDDHKLMREGLRALLEREPDVRVAGEATDGRDALVQARALLPDVIVMDLSMPGLSGIEATRHIVKALPGMRVIGLSMHVDRQYVYAMFAAGAVAYLVKNSASEELIRALRTVCEGRTYVSPAIAHVVVAALGGTAQPPEMTADKLTSREREVLQLLAEGDTSKEIATQMKIALSTVETYRRHLTEKLDLHSIAELTKYAIRCGLTSVD
jgi:DNA-binding NarL/FixJ family response regulator